MSSHELLPRGDQISQHLIRLFIEDHSADGKGYNHILSGSSGAIRSATLATDLSFVVFLVAEIQKCGHARGRFKQNVAAVTAVTTVRPAARDKFFAPKTACAVTTTAGFDMDMDFIDKH
jgi:hypothetical protein